jgi:hypothetical protein
VDHIAPATVSFFFCGTSLQIAPSQIVASQKLFTKKHEAYSVTPAPDVGSIQSAPARASAPSAVVCVQVFSPPYRRVGARDSGPKRAAPKKSSRKKRSRKKKS